MEKLLIEGGHRLMGHVNINGAKNAALAVLPATLLCDGPSVIHNLPHIADAAVLADIMTALGAKVEHSDDTMYVDPRNVATWEAPYELVRKMRASSYLMGVLLGRFGRAHVALPGGCDIGARPIDQHIKGFRAMGADIRIERGVLYAEAPDLHSAEIYMDVSTVGATINIMLAAVRVPGLTTIVNASKEPQVVDAANYLNTCGGSVRGAGTDIIKIRGVPHLNGCEYTIIPDPMEAGTFMIAAAATHGDVVVDNVIPAHLEAISAKLTEMGAHLTEGDDWVRVQVEPDQRLRAAHVKTLPYPGFPTDLQQPITVLLSTARGTSVVTETIFESRYKHIEAIVHMGARVTVEDRVAIIEGVERLTGAPVEPSDLRAGAALVIAGLAARGQTVITDLRYIDRGYEHFEDKLRQLGGKLERVNQ